MSIYPVKVEEVMSSLVLENLRMSSFNMSIFPVFMSFVEAGVGPEIYL